ncbi:hypothetical protein RRG08_033642 [Elysia crispata]|uniref:Uncharacterized protein n=1 Tax=Elysia crispata TaxID=231223 RepID=A0AAE0XQY7_9GAST|nr:hypothetical protein RRG08_033642 [Elysia crispata]
MGNIDLEPVFPPMTSGDTISMWDVPPLLYWRLAIAWATFILHVDTGSGTVPNLRGTLYLSLVVAPSCRQTCPDLPVITFVKFGVNQAMLLFKPKAATLDLPHSAIMGLKSTCSKNFSPYLSQKEILGNPISHTASLSADLAPQTLD